MIRHTVLGLALSLAVAGCQLTEEAQNRITVTLDENDGVKPVAIDTSVKQLPPLDETSLPDGNVTVDISDPNNSTYVVTITTDQVDRSRTLHFDNDVTVFVEADARSKTQKLLGLDIDDVQAIDISISGFQIRDATQPGEPPIDFSGLKSFSFRLNGRELLTKGDVENFQNGGAITRRFNRDELEPVRQALKNKQPVTLHVETWMTVQKDWLNRFPRSLHIVGTCQPKIEVSVLRAAGVNT